MIDRVRKSSGATTGGFKLEMVRAAFFNARSDAVKLDLNIDFVDRLAGLVTSSTDVVFSKTRKSSSSTSIS